MKKILSVALIVLVLVTAFSACTPVEEKIAGKWTYTETVLGIVTERTYVFNADGTGTAPGELTGDLIPLEMKWSVYEDNLAIEKTVNQAPVVYKYELKGDTLTLTKADGSVITMTRAVAAK